VGALVEPLADPVAQSIVTNLADKFETTFANHNKTLLAGIAEIMGKPAPSQVTG
jgi:ribosomal protein S17E